MKTIILRHRRENLKKCSLRGLETHESLKFYTYPKDPLPDYAGYILLKVGAPELTVADKDKGLFLIDGTWKLALVMEKQIHFPFIERSLPPHYKTAYPRRQTDCPNPETGLATVEALYIAHRILERPYGDLLDFYHWKNAFLSSNGFI